MFQTNIMLFPSLFFLAILSEQGLLILNRKVIAASVILKEIF